jgi:hypothetical protein
VGWVGGWVDGWVDGCTKGFDKDNILNSVALIFLYRELAGGFVTINSYS